MDGPVYEKLTWALNMRGEAASPIKCPEFYALLHCSSCQWLPTLNDHSYVHEKIKKSSEMGLTEDFRCDKIHKHNQDCGFLARKDTALG